MKSLVTLLSVFVSTLIFAQAIKPKINFSYNIHDFGTIKEDGGIVEYEFEFTNEGGSNLIIAKVVPSCGCTVPFWPKEPIPPNGKGTIKVEFNPMNKPGVFNKTLTVYSNASNEVVSINVTGNVLPKPKKVTDDFPDVLGSLRILSRYMNMGEVTTAMPVRKEFSIYNQSDTILVINQVVNNTDFMKISVEPTKLLPKSKGKITIEYDAAKRNDFGHLNDRFEIQTSDREMPNKVFFASVNIKKYFPEFTKEELEMQPKIKFDKSIHDFATLKQGDKPTATFSYTNVGKNTLEIYKVKPSCGCTVVEIDKKTLKSGETGKLSLVFDTQGKEGVQDKHITIYTNDPTNHAAVITLKAKIAKP